MTLAEDPRFFYANRAAQACFGYSWIEFIGMPSRLSAEMPERAARQKLLEQVRATAMSPIIAACGSQNPAAASGSSRPWSGN